MRYYIALAALAVMSSASATAQLHPEIQTGSHIPVKPVDVPEAQAGEIQQAFGKCVYKNNRTKADAFLANSDPTGVDFKGAGIDPTKLNRLFYLPECLGKLARFSQNALGLKMSPTFLRTLMQEEAYLSRVSTVPDSAAMSPAQRRFLPRVANLAVAQAGAKFADCLVEKDTPGADHLLRTARGSREHQTAARVLAPTLGACLSQGQTISFTPTSIRAFAADGLWNRFVVGTPVAARPR